MPNKRVDHTTVVMMAKTGFHPEAIAERLGCSRRQVDRIIKANGVVSIPFLKDFDAEHILWKHYKKWGESYAKIARRFGVSRQAVQQFFTEHDTNNPYDRPVVIHPDRFTPYPLRLALAEEAEFTIINEE